MEERCSEKMVRGREGSVVRDREKSERTERETSTETGMRVMGMMWRQRELQEVPSEQGKVLISQTTKRCPLCLLSNILNCAPRKMLYPVEPYW